MAERTLAFRLADIIEAIERIRGVLDRETRQTEIPWSKVAAIGNVVRHAYDRVAADVLWKLAQDDLPVLEQVCRAELAVAEEQER